MWCIMRAMSADIQVYTGGPCACNGYLVSCGSGYVAIDAPLGFAAWVATRLPQDAQLTDLFITHQHFDHVQGVAELVARFGCRVHAGMPYSRELTLEELALRVWGGGMEVQPFRVDEVQATVDKSFTCAGVEWKQYYIPGHSKDSLVYELCGTEHLFCGDVLFAGAVGRADFPGGSMATLIHGIREKLMTLPHTYEVHSGHGPSTTIGEEMLNNPYL